AASPPERTWLTLDHVPRNGSVPLETCSVFSYNILSEKYATQKQYGYTPSWALAWSYRGESILQEILLYSADVVCLQEIEVQQYQDFFQPQLKELGDYEGVYWMKTRARTMNEHERKSVDGCAIFFRSYKYTLVDQHQFSFSQWALQHPEFNKTDHQVYSRFMTKDNVAVLALLQNKDTLGLILVANGHVHWDPSYCDVKLIQVAMWTDQLEKYMHSVQSQYHVSQLPLLMCGDFNSTPGSGVYEFLHQGHVDPRHPDFLTFNYGTFTHQGLRHALHLKSAYDQHWALPFTNFTAKFADVIDYIWFSQTCVSVLGVLEGVDPEYCRKCIGFPNPHFPSEYVVRMEEEEEEGFRILFIFFFFCCCCCCWIVS
ncbi:Glucose-repressible alcohol dehydrogenase transcriptional effector, partial [Coelomomyces lativittatus]